MADILEWFRGGTWQGEFAGLPTNGNAFTLRGYGFFRVVDGKIQFQRGCWHGATRLIQLCIRAKQACSVCGPTSRSRGRTAGGEPLSLLLGVSNTLGLIIA